MGKRQYLRCWRFLFENCKQGGVKSGLYCFKIYLSRDTEPTQGAPAMSKPSFFYEPKGTNFRPASPATLIAFAVGRFIGRILRNLFGVGTGRKAA